MLLWSVCPQVRQDRTMTSEQKGEFAFQAWMETLAIEEALNEHVCGGERSTLYLVSIHLSSIVINVSQADRQYTGQGATYQVCPPTEQFVLLD